MNKNERFICISAFAFLISLPFMILIFFTFYYFKHEEINRALESGEALNFLIILIAILGAAISLIALWRNRKEELVDKTDQRLSQTTRPYSNVMTHLTSGLADSILNALDSEEPQDYKKAIEKIDEMRNILETRLEEKVCSRSHNH